MFAYLKTIRKISRVKADTTVGIRKYLDLSGGERGARKRRGGPNMLSGGTVSEAAADCREVVARRPAEVRR